MCIEQNIVILSEDSSKSEFVKALNEIINEDIKKLDEYSWELVPLLIKQINNESMHVAELSLKV